MSHSYWQRGDPLNQVATATHNVRGERTSLTLPGMSIADQFDAGGQLRKSVANSSTGIALRSDTLWYDARGKLLARLSSVGSRDTTHALYTGLGHIRYDDASSQSVLMDSAFHNVERFKHSPLGDVILDTIVTTMGWSYGGVLFFANAGSSSNTLPHQSLYDVYGRITNKVGLVTPGSTNEVYTYDANGGTVYSLVNNYEQGGLDPIS